MPVSRRYGAYFLHPFIQRSALRSNVPPIQIFATRRVCFVPAKRRPAAHALAFLLPQMYLKMFISISWHWGAAPSLPLFRCYDPAGFDHHFNVPDICLMLSVEYTLTYHFTVLGKKWHIFAAAYSRLFCRRCATVKRPCSSFCRVHYLVRMPSTHNLQINPFESCDFLRVRYRLEECSYIQHSLRNTTWRNQPIQGIYCESSFALVVH